MTPSAQLSSLGALAALLLACGDDSGASADTSTDAADTRADAADTSADAPDATSDVHDEDVPTHLDDLGFAIRVPQVRAVPQEDFGGTVDMPDADHVCRVVVDGLDGWIYVRADAVSCSSVSGCEYAVSGAWLKVGDALGPLPGATYGYGGRHHNDVIGFAHSAHTLELFHSSFGFGFRACQPPDCAKIYDGGRLATDGCGADRALPVTCVAIAADGTEPPLVDTFAKCQGDPNR